MHQGHLPSPAGSWKTSKDSSGLDTVGSTSTAHKQQPTNTKINATIVGLNDQRERQAMTIGEKGRNGVGRGDTVLGSKGSGTERLRSKGSKYRELKVGEKRSAGDNSLGTGGENEG